MSDFSVWHFDGVQAVRRHPRIEPVGAGFVLADDQQRTGPFAFADLRYHGRQGDADVYALADSGGEERDGWRLGLSGAIPDAIAAQLPAKARYGGWIDRFGLWPAAGLFAAMSVAVIAIGVKAPEWTAPLVPAAWEARLGEAIVGDLGGRFCATPAGSAALQKMVVALDPNPGDLQVEVANAAMVNAVALPGKKVVLFNGLIADARSPDEVAGVLGHEIGHVRERHVMQGLLRQLGLSVLLGGFDGNVGGTFNGLLALSYGREAEGEADAHAIAALARANVSAQATADFFARLAKDEEAVTGKDDNALIGYLSSHPMSSKRRDRFAASVDKRRRYAQVLTAGEWRALKNMCVDDKDVADGGVLF